MNDNDQAPQPQPQPDPFAEIDAALNGTLHKRPQQQMAAAQVAAADIAPDQAAKAAALARTAQVDPSAVIGNEADIAAKARDEQDRAQHDAIVRRHPELAQWLSQPTNAAVARGDLVNLRAVSTALQSIAPTADQFDDRPNLPLSSAFQIGVDNTVANTNKLVLAIPSWIQKETRDLFGVSSEPSPYTPLGLFYQAQDWQSATQRARQEWFKPSAGRDVVSGISAAISDPLSSIMLPEEGGYLAVQATRTLDAAVQAKAAITGAAATQAAVSAGQTLISQAEQARTQPSKPLADAANVATQAALAFFFGKLGQELPIQRTLNTLPRTAAPVQDFFHDLARNAVAGGTQSVASGVAEGEIHGDGMPDAASLLSLYTSGAIPGAIMSLGTAPEAAAAARHWESLRNAESLSFANKLAVAVDSLQRSQATKVGPEQVGQLVDAIVKAGKAPEAVYLQAGAWQDHFLGQGLDPVAEAAKAGLQDEYVQARGTGGDMRIPLKQALGLALGAEEPAGLIAQMRAYAHAPTAVEAAHYFDQPSPDQVASATKLAQEQAAGAEKPSTLADQRAAAAMAAGVPEDEAKALGLLHQRFFERLAQHHNDQREDVGGERVTADNLAEQFRLTIRRVLPEMLRQHLATGQLAPFLDALRTNGPQNDLEHAGRNALARLGLDVQQHSNDEILAKLQAVVAEPKPTAESPASPIVPLSETRNVNGRRVVLADVPYGGGMSRDGKTVYIDRRIPHTITLDGKPLDVHRAIAEHEIREFERMEAGEPYAQAHDHATDAEHDLVDHQGFSHEQYEQAIAPFIDEALRSSQRERIPADLDRRPYEASNEPHLVDGASGPTYPQEIKGTYQRSAAEHIISLMASRDASTAFHESAHYFLEVLSELAQRDGAPKSLVDDVNAILDWSGYGDVARMRAMQDELRTLQAKENPTDADRARMAELAKPHETFARGFEQYLLTGRAPATGLRRAFSRLKALMRSVYRNVRDLLKESPKALDEHATRLFDRLFASDREIERAKERAGDVPAFSDQASSGMSDKEWAKYQAARAEADRQEQDALDRAVMEHDRAAQTEQYAKERAEVREQMEEEVGRERVHDATKQLQKGETWDGRKLAQPLKIDRSDLERLVPDKADRAKLPRGISTRDEHGVSVDDAALALGYGPGGGMDMLREMMAAPNRKAEIERRTDAEMQRRYPDITQSHPALEKAADRAVHEPDARAVVNEMERAHLAKLVNVSRAEAADRAQREALAKQQAQKNSGVDADAQRLADALSGGVQERVAADQQQRDQENAAATKAAQRQQAADAKSLDRQAQQIADALGRQAVRQASTRDERLAMRVAAEATIRDQRAVDVDPDRYIVAERRAAIALAKALQAKDYETALRQKRVQMMNAELARAAHAADEQIAKDKSYLRKASFDERYRTNVAKAGGLEYTVTHPDGTTKVYDRADDDGRSAEDQARDEAKAKGGTYERTSGYLEQMDAMLERYDVKPVSAASLKRREALRAFLERTMTQRGPDGERMPSGAYADIPAHLVDETTRKHIDELTVSELRDLRSGVNGIAALANQVRDLMSTDRRERIADQARLIAEQVRATGKKPLRGKIADLRDALVAGEDGTSGGLLTKPLRTLGNWIAEMRQVPRLIYEMDGFKDGGPVAKALLFPLIDAGDRETAMKADLRKQMADAFDAWGKRVSSKRETIPGAGLNREGRPWRLTLLDRINVLMHYGNPEGRQRLLDLNKWGDKEVHAIIDSLDSADIAFANRLVDLFSSHWSDIKALEERFNGIAPPKVDAIPVELPNGTYKGGYRRIYYDGESPTSLERMAEQLADEGMVGGGYRRPTTSNGATKERVAKVTDRVLSLKASDWTRALNEMAHDLTHREALHDYMRTINHPEVRSAMQEAWGSSTWAQFAAMAKGLAAGHKPAVNTLERVGEYLRVGMNYANRAFNPVYALAQYAGLPLALQRVGPKYLASAFLQCYSGPLAIDHTSRWIEEQSTTMRLRARTRDAQIGDALSDTNLAGSFRKVMDTAGMFMLTKVWQHMDNVVWKGAYDQHLDTGATHEDAVRVANQVVESVMGSNKVKDTPGMMRGGNALLQAFTSNMSWAAANLNNIATEMNRGGAVFTRTGQGGSAQVARALGGLATLCVIGPMLWDWLSDELEGKGTSEFDSGRKVVHKLWTAPAYAVASGIPIVRDLEAQFVEGRKPKEALGMGWLHSMQQLGTDLHADHKQGYDITRDAVGAAGPFLHVPSSEIIHLMDGYRFSQQHGDGDAAATAWRLAAGPPPKR